MNKKLIRLTEADLHRIVKESVNKVLNEIGDTNRGQYLMGRAAARAEKYGVGGKGHGIADDIRNAAEKSWGGSTSDAFDNGHSNQLDFMDSVDKYGPDEARYAEGGDMDIRRMTDYYNRLDFKDRRNAARDKYRFRA